MPAVILLPLSLYFDFNTLTLALIWTNVLGFASLNLFAFLRSKKSLQLRWRDLPKSLSLSFFVDLCFMPANLVGMSNELRKKDQDWITRKITE